MSLNLKSIFSHSRGRNELITPRTTYIKNMRTRQSFKEVSNHRTSSDKISSNNPISAKNSQTNISNKSISQPKTTTLKINPNLVNFINHSLTVKNKNDLKKDTKFIEYTRTKENFAQTPGKEVAF